MWRELGGIFLAEGVGKIVPLRWQLDKRVNAFLKGNCLLYVAEGDGKEAVVPLPREVVKGGGADAA